jgi:hypothetical protein
VGDATLISGAGLWPSSLALADCSRPQRKRGAAACHHQTACICSSKSCISSAKGASSAYSPPRVSSQCFAHGARPRACRDCECLLRDAHRTSSSPTNIWPLQCYDREARGMARKWEDIRISCRATATVTDAHIVCNSPASRPSSDRRRI